MLFGLALVLCFCSSFFAGGFAVRPEPSARLPVRAGAPSLVSASVSRIFPPFRTRAGTGMSGIPRDEGFRIVPCARAPPVMMGGFGEGWVDVRRRGENRTPDAQTAPRFDITTTFTHRHVEGGGVDALCAFSSDSELCVTVGDGNY